MGWGRLCAGPTWRVFGSWVRIARFSSGTGYVMLILSLLGYLLLWWVPLTAMAMVCTGIVVSAPLGALAFWLVRGRKSETPARVALVGGVMWACGFLPWVHLMARSFGVPVVRPLLWAAYIFLYVAWLVGPVGTGFVAGAVSISGPFSRHVLEGLVLYSLPVLNLVALLFTLFRVWRAREGGAERHGHAVYVVPFGLVTAGFILWFWVQVILIEGAF